MRLIDADTVVHWQSYDDEHETFQEHEGTIAEFLDSMTDEGCPGVVDAVPVVRCKDCKHNPLETWFDCPLAHLKYDGERWCWKGERKDGDHAEGTIQKERS